MEENLKKGLLILHEPIELNDMQNYFDSLSKYNKLLILTFLGNEGTQLYLKYFNKHVEIEQITVVRASDRIKEAAELTRKEYLRFIVEWPKKIKSNNRNFKELFVYKDRLSLWWLTEMQKKDSEGSPAFNLLCQMEIVKQLMKENDFKQCFLFSDTHHFSDLITQLCKKYNSEFISNCSNRRTDIRKTLLWHGLGRIKFSFYLFFNKLFFTFFSKAFPPILKDESPDGELIIFSTLYPDTWQSVNGKYLDRNYLELPDYISENTPYTSRYASFYRGAPWTFFKLLLNIKKGNVSLSNDKFIFLEKYMGFKEILGFLTDWSVLVRYLLLEKHNNSFQKSFEFSDVNIKNLLINELRASLVGAGILRCLTWSIAYETLVKELNCKYVVSFLELYPNSKALYDGVKHGNPNTKTIAYQHATITKMKLWYCYSPEEMDKDGNWIDKMPIPDIFIFQGELGRKILVAGGYPKEKCFVTGSPRYGGLAKALNFKREDVLQRVGFSIPKGKKIVLVATTYMKEDSKGLVFATVEACSKRKDCFLIFKAHPNYSIEDTVSEATKQLGLKDYIVLSDNIQDLIKISDVLITTYSTTADEAIALGCPVISLTVGAKPNMGTFWDIEAAPEVFDATGINKWLDIIFYHPQKFSIYREQWDDLIQGSFYKIDENAKERFVKALDNI